MKRTRVSRKQYHDFFKGEQRGIECDYCGRKGNVKKTTMRGGWDNHILELHPACREKLVKERRIK